MNRAVTAAALLCAAGLTVLAACGQSTAGEPMPSDVPAQEEQTSSEAPATEPDDYTLTDLCGLLEPDEAARLHAPSEGRPTNSVSTGADLCTWRGEMYLVAGAQPGGTTEGLESGPDQILEPAEVADMSALRKKTPSLKACELLFELPSDTLFSISAGPLSSGEGKYDSCAVVDEFAAITVPRVKDD
ncbi:DUF3558 domain-containing protein [Actinophytocola gossypii]|uniref:DUF3558 domain-containing protein n=1 Tax=Actinophytocola gossypii TaxID=2812003 RepID=A0ABT2J4W2_9PSEU|nr:DUF3558 domain-containing protein [Actinophytocola gossypii]MCT2582535.1 DUF3558 domain-containing protein [Actinophytocola gossypii]